MMPEVVTYLLIALSIVNLIVAIILIRRNSGIDRLIDRITGAQKSETADIASLIRDEMLINRSESTSTQKSMREELSAALENVSLRFDRNAKDLGDTLDKKINEFRIGQTEIENRLTENMRSIRQSTEKQLEDIRRDNEKQLTEMRVIVDEKLHTTLEKRLGESFGLVSERLETVHKDLGEMRTLADGVGDLKRVLTNVKTRGITGEVMLEGIIEQILAPGQYVKNASVNPDKRVYVEFAVNLPGHSDGEYVVLPIDSKFPLEAYRRLNSAEEAGDKESVENERKALLQSVKGFAKDVSAKYICPPYTTDFALLFLPVEDLYAEVLRAPGFFEMLQNEYKITPVGPTTLSAVLHGFKAGFAGLAVSKRSSEIAKVLESVKSEFGKFADLIDKIGKNIESAGSTLNELRTTRTNAIIRKLKDIGNEQPDDGAYRIASDNEQS